MVLSCIEVLHTSAALLLKHAHQQLPGPNAVSAALEVRAAGGRETQAWQVGFAAAPCA